MNSSNTFIILVLLGLVLFIGIELIMIESVLHEILIACNS